MNVSWLSVCLKSGSHNGLSGIRSWVHWEENCDALKNGTKHGKDEARILRISVLFSLCLPSAQQGSPRLTDRPLSCHPRLTVRPDTGLGTQRGARGWQLQPRPQRQTPRRGHAPSREKGPWFGAHLTTILHAVRRMNHFKPIWWFSLMRKNSSEIKEGLWVSEHTRLLEEDEMQEPRGSLMPQRQGRGAFRLHSWKLRPTDGPNLRAWSRE